MKKKIKISLIFTFASIFLWLTFATLWRDNCGRNSALRYTMRDPKAHPDLCYVPIVQYLFGYPYKRPANARSREELLRNMTR